jgi:hypothetical protein
MLGRFRSLVATVSASLHLHEVIEFLQELVGAFRGNS